MKGIPSGSVNSRNRTRQACRVGRPVVASKPVAFFRAKARTIGWIGALVLLFAIGLRAAAAARLPAVRLVPGESLHYLLEYHSSIQSQSAGPIYTSSPAHSLEISVGARLRVDVLSVKDEPKQGRLTRLRVTYETCDATVQGDQYDPGAEQMQKQYRDLRGRSFEFTVDGQGRVVDLAGIKGLTTNPSAQNAMRQWLANIALPLSLGRGVLKPGKKWSRVVPFSGAPLAGLAWRTESTYRDNEPCPAVPRSPAGSHGPGCAVIATRLESVKGKSHGGRTPLLYRRQGLKTSGRWTARGQSLNYISLATGLLSSSTATENDDVDLTVTSELSGSRLHYAGQEKSSSQIALVGITLPGHGGKGANHHGSIRGK